MSCHRSSANLVALSRLLMMFLAVVFPLVCTNTTMAQSYGQRSEERSGATPGGSDQSSASMRGSSGGASLRVVPSITGSQRYDSNVLLSTQKLYDYVTNIRASTRVQYKDDLVDGAVTGGLVSEVYARNPSLNYVGADASFSAILDQVVKRIVPGLGLRISDSVRYSPQQPAFLTPQAPVTSFTYGLQAVRNNSIVNAANILGEYAITPLAHVNVSYSHQMMRFLNEAIPGLSGGLYNTTIQSLLVGPEYRIAPTQSIGVSYQYQQMSFEPSSGTAPGLTQIVQAATVKWTTLLTRELTAEISPGIAIVSSFSGGLEWTMNGRMQWSDGKTTAGLSYIRGASPGYYLAGSALINDTVTVSLAQNITNQWSIFSQSNYATGRALGGVTFKFESFGETIGVNYAFYPGMVAGVTATYNSFTFHQLGQETQFDRQAFMLSLSAEWN